MGKYKVNGVEFFEWNGVPHCTIDQCGIEATYPFEMIRFRYLSANYCPYEMLFRSLKFFPFHMTRKMTVLSIVNRGRKIPCRISNRQSCFISKGTSSVISKRQTASFRNDSFATHKSIINLNVLSK